jgi:hypothetical protein
MASVDNRDVACEAMPGEGRRAHVRCQGASLRYVTPAAALCAYAQDSAAACLQRH